METSKLFKKKKIFNSIGEKCYYHPYRIPAEPWLVSFGDNVFVGTDVLFITHNMSNCVFNNINNECLRPIVDKIKIGNNVFIGAKSIIMYGVNIGSNVIIGAGSIVTKDIEDNSVVAGVPAKVIGNFNDQFIKCKKFNNDFKKYDTGNQIEDERKYFYGKKRN